MEVFCLAPLFFVCVCVVDFRDEDRVRSDGRQFLRQRVDALVDDGVAAREVSISALLAHQVIQFDRVRQVAVDALGHSGVGSFIVEDVGAVPVLALLGPGSGSTGSSNFTSPLKRIGPLSLCGFEQVAAL